jgi:topoisomerase IV subunit A
MAYVKSLFETNFIEYASYVIKDRAIPDLSDGLKPVQRRILHSLFEMDDGKFHKVANVVGHCMKYHPHGDASIGGALVVLANKSPFIDTQGNFGNIFTGDEASAPRYIECRASAFAKEVLYNPDLTDSVDSYDGRNKEPVAFPAKIPVILAIGAEGIAVGMSTKILPHNLKEILQAEKACLLGKKFQLFPDFPSGGLMDVSGYRDGNGKVLVRAKLDLSDPKRIVIRELPFGSTTESLIESIEAAAKSGKLRVSGISDFTTDKVEIEIKLQRGVYTEEVVDALYAFTDCEQSISVNFLVIKDNLPVVMSVTEVLKYQAQQLVQILKAELELEQRELRDKIHERTLEQIFIEERIYKKIEQIKTQEGVAQAVFKGLEPFRSQIKREVTADDVERLLRIPIRRISLYDINKVKDEMKLINARLKQIAVNLKNIVGYAVEYVDSLSGKLGPAAARKTQIISFSKVDVREAARRDIPLRYDGENGYLGTQVSGQSLFEVSSYDRVLVIKKNGMYSVIDVPEKVFVDTDLLYCALVEDKDELAKTVFTILYKDPESGYPMIKRCSIDSFMFNKDYSLVPEGSQVFVLEDEEDFRFTVKYNPKPKLRILEERFKASDYPVKGLKTQGIRLASRTCKKISKGE